MDDPKNRNRQFAQIARLSSVGIGLVISAAIGYFIGETIDHYAHTAPVFTLIFILVGIAAGMLNVFRTLGQIGN